ncbi:hypothetical protein FH972_022922 [Carpinus fangiana]|uniref:Uncharacterized protein n=1 Tax=Carpinus fangiana TaxID=176857 RepID=A0A5N6KU57_9ROSI|nr:hypothetical protein FH972_022922 [Carpinus fangiana]
MALDAEAAQNLIAQLASEREAYLTSATKTQELLLRLLSGSSDLTPLQSLPEARRRTTTANVEVDSMPLHRAGSNFTGDDTSSSDDNESLFVQTALERQLYDMDGFREHLKSYAWTAAGLKILRGVDTDEKLLKRGCIFPTNLAEAQLDRSHLSHYSIFDVGADGAPLDIQSTISDPTRALAVWNRVRATNVDHQKLRPAVGRITTVREPSPLLFAALHYTMNKHIDMDEVFDFMVDDDPPLSYPHRAFAENEKHRRSFIVTMEYFTIIGEGCEPMSWQHFDKERDFGQTHIPISRCGSVIVLAFEGPPMSRVKNRDRRVSRRYGDVYDPFSPWRVLSIQAYPDWKSSVDAHDSTHHYANGPEAFLVTLRAEYNDARKRLRDVYIRVGDLVEPPPNFIFDANVRDRLLFEDKSFTYSRRYFWAYQTLSIMNQDITEMVESYRETFKDSVWDGSNKIIWPGESSQSSRYNAWRKRMSRLRRDIDYEIDKLEEVRVLNENKMKDIKALRDNLFSGTSVMESRRSVEQTAITVAQNRSIMLLTLVTIFFLPLTFVTSVFGMTNMDPNEDFRHFAWTTLGICVPTYLLIGSLNTETGLQFWQGKTRALFNTLGWGLARLLHSLGWTPEWAKGYFEDPHDDTPDMSSRMKRTTSIDEAMRARETRDGWAVHSTSTRRESHLDLEQKELRSMPPLNISSSRGAKDFRSKSISPLKQESRISFSPVDMRASPHLPPQSGQKSVPTSPTLPPLGSLSASSTKEKAGDTGSDTSSVKRSRSGSMLSRILSLRKTSGSTSMRKSEAHEQP